MSFVGGEPGPTPARVPNAGAVLHSRPALGVLHARKAQQRRCGRCKGRGMYISGQTFQMFFFLLIYSMIRFSKSILNLGPPQLTVSEAGNLEA